MFKKGKASSGAILELSSVWMERWGCVSYQSTKLVTPPSKSELLKWKCGVMKGGVEMMLIEVDGAWKSSNIREEDGR